MMTSSCQPQEVSEDSAARASRPPGHTEGFLPTPCGHTHLAAPIQAWVIEKWESIVYLWSKIKAFKLEK